MIKLPLDKVIQDDVSRALFEDIGGGDLTSQLISGTLETKGLIINREKMILAGRAWVDRVFLTLNEKIEIEWFWDDGDFLEQNTTICSLSGPAREILTGERTALNFLQFFSGIATRTQHFKNKIKGARAELYDTRKTLPGLREGQKYSVRVGGGKNQRMGLFDQILIKENHLKAQGSIIDAVNLARKKYSNLFIQIEVESLSEFKLAISAIPDLILLDNFSIEDLSEAVAMRKKLKKTDIFLEASGGITNANISQIAQTGVERISLGTLTKDVKAIDLSLKLDL